MNTTHRHGLGYIAGYLLKRTVWPTGEASYLAAYQGDPSYAKAISDKGRLARADRRAAYSVVTVYLDGCSSDDRTDGLALLAHDYTTAEAI